MADINFNKRIKIIIIFYFFIGSFFLLNKKNDNNYRIVDTNQKSIIKFDL